MNLLHRIAQRVALVTAVIGVAGCLELPERLYACAPDGGCPAGLSCGAQQLCLPADGSTGAGDGGEAVDAGDPADGGQFGPLVTECSTATGQVDFARSCPGPAAGCEPDFVGTWCTAGACAPLVVFPALDGFCKSNGAHPAWTGHSGTVRGGRAYASDGGTVLSLVEDEQLEISVDLVVFSPCVPGGTCEDTRAELESRQGGLEALCVEEGPGCRCSLQWMDTRRRSREIILSLGTYTELPEGTPWNACVDSAGLLALESMSATPAVVFTYGRR